MSFWNLRFGVEFTDREGNRRWPPILVVTVPTAGYRMRIDTMQLASIFNLIIVTAGALAAAFWFSDRGITLFDITLLLTTQFLVGLGITLGYHRLFCHKAFSAGRGVSIVLGALAAASMQGKIMTWVSVHRKHHHHSDEVGDPHSPKSAGEGFVAALLAFLDGHVGWTVSGRLCNYTDYVRDLRRDEAIAFADRYYWLWVLMGWLIPGLISAAWYGSWPGFVSGVLGAGAMRVFLQLQATWAVNSLGHLWGSRPFVTKDDSRNNPLVNAMTLVGEGLHNNHHAFQWSAKFSLHKGEIDPGFWVLRVLARTGLVWDVKIPGPDLIEARGDAAGHSGAGAG